MSGREMALRSLIYKAPRQFLHSSFKLVEDSSYLRTIAPVLQRTVWMPEIPLPLQLKVCIVKHDILLPIISNLPP
jgi:hypothetical protein